MLCVYYIFFFFSSRRRHTRSLCDWSSDVCSSDLDALRDVAGEGALCLARRRVRLEGGEHRVDLRAWQEGEELQGALRVAVVRIEPELVELVDRCAGGIEPDGPARRLPEFRPRRGSEERRHEPVRLAVLYPADQID